MGRTELGGQLRQSSVRPAGVTVEREENDAPRPGKDNETNDGACRSTIAGGCRVLFSRLPAVSRDLNPDHTTCFLGDPISASGKKKLIRTCTALHCEGGKK